MAGGGGPGQDLHGRGQQGSVLCSVGGHHGGQDGQGQEAAELDHDDGGGGYEVI